MPKKNSVPHKNKYLLGILFSLIVILFGYLIVIQPYRNNLQMPIPREEGPKLVEPTYKPRPSPVVSLGQLYTTNSGRISFTVPVGWIITDSEGHEASQGAITIQGPKQVLKLYENFQPDHGFDDFKTEKVMTQVAGKRFSATKFTSQTWGSSFISVHIQDKPYILYIEYGDAASVGFKGFNQEYQDKVNFEQDIKSIEELLRTIKY